MWRCRHASWLPQRIAVPLSVVFCIAVSAPGWSQGSISGVVRAAGSATPLPDAIITVSGSVQAARSGRDGRFVVGAVAGGEHVVIVRRIGFEPDTLTSVIVSPSSTTPVIAELVHLTTKLDTVSVRSVSTNIAATGASPSVELTRADIARTPQIADDAFRAVTRVPGVTASDLSAGFRVRGGANREVLLSLDGMELYEPFHLKDLDGAISIIDPGILGDANVSTGGFGARYGDHLTGVFALQSRDDVVSATHGSLTASLSGVGAELATPIGGSHADVMASARKGLLATALDVAGDGGTLAPRYDDSYARIRIRPNASNQLTVSALRSNDGLFFYASGEPSLASEYGSSYVWATWTSMPTTWLTTRAMVSSADLDWERTGGETSNSGLALQVDDRRGFQAQGIQQSVTVDESPRLRTEAGAQYRSLQAQYNYARQQALPVVEAGEWVTDSNHLGTRFTAHGATLGAYLTQFAQVTHSLGIEAGLRYDKQSYTGEHMTSPRVAAAYALGGRSTLHAAWGLYAQPQALYELQVEDGVTHFSRAERAEQYVLGIDHRFDALTLKLEVYDRQLLRLDPQYVNLESSFDVFPEAGNDRVLINPVRGSAKGLEFSASSTRGPVQWLASYALASSRDVVDGVSLPSPYDQRHSIHVDASASPHPGWRVSAAWEFHSGWPATPITFGVDTLVDGSHHVRAQYGIFNSTRIGPYHRLDFRVSNDRRLGPGKLSVYLDVFNVYGRNNPRGLGYTVADWNSAEVVVSQRSKLQLPRIPTLGVQWTF
ncbi:MAG TPA: TonB-dependent receptor [Gemmatimonadaceae bacterium]|nr:TonB-dependent receptor [Gemmatimonadaceae bacterium]